MDLPQIDWQLVLNHATHLIFAYVLALPIGWDREHSKRQFGPRTFPLVAVLTCHLAGCIELPVAFHIWQNQGRYRF